MRNLRIAIIIALFLLQGCIVEQPTPATPTIPSEPVLKVNLNTPVNGSEVLSMTPTLAWSSSIPANYYHLQMAADSNFQNIIIDSTNLADSSYAVRSGALEYNHTYYWRVNASKGGLTSAWSESWYFKTRGETAVSITVNAMLDGVPWRGNINFSISGPYTDYGSAVPMSFDKLSAGTYTLTYNSGGPTGAKLASITPSPSQSATAGGSISFTIDFHKEATGTIIVNAVLDGMAWEGKVSYSINGPVQDFNAFVPGNFNDIPAGKYSLVYNAGGPPGATLVSIYPSPMQQLTAGGTLNYTLYFHMQQQYGSIEVNAITGNEPIYGHVTFALSGPLNINGTAPARYTNLPPGIYTVTVTGGAPIGVMFQGIRPSETQNLLAGSSIYFTIVYGGALVPQTK